MKLFICYFFALILIACRATAQTDSSYNSGSKNQPEFVSKVKLPVRLLSVYSLNKFKGINPAQNNIPGSSIIYQEMQRQNVSGTILQVLGIACLTVFGDRTNHPYQFRNH